MRIDSHQHIWRLARGDYGWLTADLGPLYRDFGMDDLAPQRAALGIEGAILVQAAETLAETRWLLDVAEADARVLGVVGWADFAAGDAPETIAALAADPLLKGLRPMLQDMEDEQWILGARCAPALGAMERHGLVFDALVRPRHLPAIAELAARYPDLSIVLDHAGKPDPRGDLSGWRADIATLAARPNISAKLSGLVTEAGPGWTVETLRPVVETLLAAFGPSRLLWGSDWPVLLLAASHEAWWEASLRLLASLDAAEREAILGGNAARVYGLKRRKEERH
ncbi:amidohydrolase family protein [Thermaurantiacus sp.]